MTTLAVPSFDSAPIPAKRPTATAFNEMPPWRGILAVEPDIAALNAGTLLLTNANYCVTPATGVGELFVLRETIAFALAILSDRLGHRLLRTVAKTVRRQWPRARILILGQSALMLEDHLYDEQIYRSTDPEQVLADIESLYEGMWNQRSNSLDWNATGSAQTIARPPISESDPAKNLPGAPAQIKSPRDTPFANVLAAMVAADEAAA